MNITPDTNIRLLKCPLELDNKNQITFSNTTAQYNYFNSLPYIEVDGSMYQRKDSSIYYPALYDDLVGYTYVMYQNTNYSNKWFYAYITDVTYKSDGMSELKIKTDVFQTYQFNVVWKQSFVEREHVSVANDTYHSNTIEENLQLGEIICNKKNSLFHENIDSIATNTDLAIIVGVTETATASQIEGGVQQNGIYSGLRYFAFKNDSGDLQFGIPALNDWIENYGQNAKADAIQCLFMYPARFVSGALQRQDHLIAGTNLVDRLYINGEGTTLNKNIDLQQMNLDGYVPKNKKTLCYPYNYLLVSNNNGSNVIYRLEEFYTTANNQKTVINPQFEINNCLTPRWKHKAYS